MREWTEEEREAARQRADRAVSLVASVNRVRLAPDDPLLVTTTLLHDFLLQSDQHQQEAFRAFRVDLEHARLSWEEASRHRAETVLTAALEASREAMQADLAAAAHASSLTLSEAFREAAAPLAASVRMAYRMAWLNVLAAALTLIAATITVAALLRFSGG